MEFKFMPTLLLKVIAYTSDNKEEAQKALLELERRKHEK